MLQCGGSRPSSRVSVAGPVPNPEAPSIRWPRLQRTSMTSATGCPQQVARTTAAMYGIVCSMAWVRVWWRRLHVACIMLDRIQHIACCTAASGCPNAHLGDLQGIEEHECREQDGQRSERQQGTLHDGCRDVNRVLQQGFDARKSAGGSHCCARQAAVRPAWGGTVPHVHIYAPSCRWPAPTSPIQHIFTTHIMTAA